MTRRRERTAAAADAHPSGDERFHLIDTSMKRHHHRPDALIEVLHTAQELFGHLDHDILFYIARGLTLPPSRVYGVASFYHLFRFKPKGKHQCTVCLGTACYVNGAAPSYCRPSNTRPESTRGAHWQMVDSRWRRHVAWVPAGSRRSWSSTARCVGSKNRRWSVNA